MAEKHETVTIPAQEWQRVLQRLEAAEQRSAAAIESVTSSRAKIIDREYEAWKLKADRPASVRTQEIANERYPKGTPYRCSFDPTGEDGKPKNISEHFPLQIRANSDLEAKARYLDLMGISKHSYKVIVEPVGAELQPA